MKNKLFLFILFIIYCLHIPAVNYDLEENGVLYDIYSTSLAQMDIVGFTYSVSEDLVIPTFVKYRKPGQTRYITYQIHNVDRSAFSGCTKIKTLSFEYICGSVLPYAFRNCSNLTTLYLGGVRGLLPNAFEGCISLVEIHTDNTTPCTIYQNTFDESTYENAVLYVPAGCLEAYRENENWNRFSNIVECQSETNSILSFADANVKALCVANWDTNDDGELDKEEAAAVADLGQVFFLKDIITSFDELRFFTGLTKIGENAFVGCSGLTSVTIPNSVNNIGSSAFQGCI